MPPFVPAFSLPACLVRRGHDARLTWRCAMAVVALPIVLAGVRDGLTSWLHLLPASIAYFGDFVLIED